MWSIFIGELLSRRPLKTVAGLTLGVILAWRLRQFPSLVLAAGRQERDP
jgi:hypothetical protein